MRFLKIGLALVAAVLVCLSACGTHDGGQSSTGGGGTSGLIHCEVYGSDTSCDTCLHHECCHELATCGAMDSCIACATFYGSIDLLCILVRGPADAVFECADDKCHFPCWGPT